MKIVVFVNTIADLSFRQTTAMLIASLARQHDSVYIAQVDQFVNPVSVDSTLVVHNIPHRPKINSNDIEKIAVDITPPNRNADADKEASSSKKIKMSPLDSILLRTNPGRDELRSQHHRNCLTYCQDFFKQSGNVINDPTNLEYFASKASLQELDAKFRPEMVVSSLSHEIVEFVSNSNCDCIVKPAVGSRGRNVIRVPAHSKTGAYPNDLTEVLDSTFASQMMVAQHFVESKEPGDKRVVIWDGEVVEQDGKLGGVHRLPSAGEFRANLHLGGTPQKLVLHEQQRTAVKAAAKLLYSNGIRLAGIDLIGSKVIEFNVFSTGGLYPAFTIDGIDFSDRIAKSILA